jgi:hypothetical protein
MNREHRKGTWYVAMLRISDPTQRESSHDEQLKLLRAHGDKSGMSCAGVVRLLNRAKGFDARLDRERGRDE